MEIIVPAAGLSSRFPNMPPKFMLRDNYNKTMLEKVVEPFFKKYNITVAVLKQHYIQYNIKELFKDLPISFIVIDELTRGPADTIWQTISLSGIKGEFLIRDCDSFFDHDIKNGNYVCATNVSKYETLNNLSNKSFVVCNDQNIITKIIEKNVISPFFCVGGYKFESVKLFKDGFDKIKNNENELYVSHVIEQNIIDGNIFELNDVNNYYDVGTKGDWEYYLRT